jgi:ESCRT-II complex subunit VPS36
MTMEVAMMEGITVALTKEMIDDAETKGDVVRDDMESYFVSDEGTSEGGGGSVGGVGAGDAAIKWWPNVFAEYAWDGEVFTDTGGS